jgi:hypothetical protein
LQQWPCLGAGPPASPQLPSTFQSYERRASRSQNLNPLLPGPQGPVGRPGTQREVGKSTEYWNSLHLHLRLFSLRPNSITSGTETQLFPWGFQILTAFRVKRRVKERGVKVGVLLTGVCDSPITVASRLLSGIVSDPALRKQHGEVTRAYTES